MSPDHSKAITEASADKEGLLPIRIGVKVAADGAVRLLNNATKQAEIVSVPDGLLIIGSGLAGAGKSTASRRPAHPDRRQAQDRPGGLGG